MLHTTDINQMMKEFDMLTQVVTQKEITSTKTNNNTLSATTTVAETSDTLSSTTTICRIDADKTLKCNVNKCLKSVLQVEKMKTIILIYVGIMHILIHLNHHNKIKKIDAN